MRSGIFRSIADSISVWLPVFLSFSSLWFWHKLDFLFRWKSDHLQWPVIGRQFSTLPMSDQQLGAGCKKKGRFGSDKNLHDVIDDPFSTMVGVQWQVVHNKRERCLPGQLGRACLQHLPRGELWLRHQFCFKHGVNRTKRVLGVYIWIRVLDYLK